MQHSRNKSSGTLTVSTHSQQPQKPQPFSPNIPGSKTSLSKFSPTKQPRVLSSAVHSARNKSQTVVQPVQGDKKLKLNFNIPLFDQLPNLAKAPSLSSRSSQGGVYLDTDGNMETDNSTWTPKKPVKAENLGENGIGNNTAKSFFNKYQSEKLERKMSSKDSDTEDTIMSATSRTEHKPKIIGTIRASERFAVLNKVVSQSQKAKANIGIVKSARGPDTTENISVVSIQTSPDKRGKASEKRETVELRLNVKNDASPRQRKRESFSANGFRKPLIGVSPMIGGQKRSSRIMTKELELKYGIKLDRSESSSESEQDLERIDTEGNTDSNMESVQSIPGKVPYINGFSEANGTGMQPDQRSPKKRNTAVKEFLLRRQVFNNLKLAEMKGSLDKQECELFIKNFPESATDRPRTQGHSSRKIWDDDLLSERNYSQTHKTEGEKVFVNGHTDFFQLNTGSKTYRDYKEIFTEELKTNEVLEEKSTVEDDKEKNDEYKPMIVWFGSGSKILQPKYMAKMGSMCCTELWPKKLSMYMQKHLVSAKDWVRMTHGGRNHETVYRPKKWQNEETIQKNINKNIQARRNGHDSLAVRSAVPSSRKAKSVQTQKTTIADP